MKITYDSKVILGCFFVSVIAYFLNRYAMTDTIYFYFTASKINFYNYNIFSFITYICGHKEYEHFFNNFFIILLIGPLIEKYYGSLILLFFIIVNAIICAMVVVFIEDKSIYGSSVIAFMLIGILMMNNLKGQNKYVSLSSLLFVSLYCFNDFVGLLSNDDVSHISHLISLVDGSVFGYFVKIDNAI